MKITKYLFAIFFQFILTYSFAQNENNQLDFNSKKERLIEKEIIKIGEFKDLTFQKISFKDLSDDSTLNVFGIMTFLETFNTISKRTLTLSKDELSKLIESIEKIAQKSKANPENEIKYKYETKNRIEIGSNYNPISKSWTNYIDLPSTNHNQGLIKFSKSELNELIILLKSVEEKL